MIDTINEFLGQALAFGWQLYLFIMFVLLVTFLGKYAWGWITGKYR